MLDPIKSYCLTLLIPTCQAASSVPGDLTLTHPPPTPPDSPQTPTLQNAKNMLCEPLVVLVTEGQFRENCCKGRWGWGFR